MPQPVALPQTTLNHAHQAVADAQWVNSAQVYEEMAQALGQRRMIGIDTEFVRERTYYPIPGLVQISDGTKIWLVDVVTLQGHAPLHSLMGAHASTKVLHSVGEDLEVLSLLTNAYPTPLFDTQMAAAMLGFPLQMRYEHLVEVIFGDALPGGQARSNWCRRPLGDALLAYAAQDVIYLPAMAEILSESLDHCGRLSWLEQDCQRLIEQAAEASDPLLKVKGAGRLSRTAMAYVASLALWRDQQAKQRNLPKSFVLKDQALLALGTRAEHGTPAQAVDALPPSAKRWKDACLAVMEATDINTFEIPNELRPLSTDQRQLLKDWQQKTATLAESLNLDPGVVASKRQLTRLLRGETPEWLNGWRGPLLKDALALAIK